MSILQQIYNDIRSLRGAEVKVFGQPTTLSSEVSDESIDILDVIDALRPYELMDLIVLEYNEATGDHDEKEAEDVDEYLDFLEELGYINIQNSKGDNSYNWSSPVSNDFNINEYHNQVTGTYLYEFRVHRFGDVRGNYTETALLEFDHQHTFMEVLGECSKSIEVNGYDVYISIFGEDIEVYKDGEYVKTIYDLDDLVEDQAV